MVMKTLELGLFQPMYTMGYSGSWKRPQIQGVCVGCLSLVPSHFTMDSLRCKINRIIINIEVKSRKHSKEHYYKQNSATLEEKIGKLGDSFPRNLDIWREVLALGREFKPFVDENMKGFDSPGNFFPALMCMS